MGREVLRPMVEAAADRMVDQAGGGRIAVYYGTNAPSTGECAVCGRIGASCGVARGVFSGRRTVRQRD